MTMPSVAITVPTWRRGEMFRDCVWSLLNQDYEGHIEVMCVVDREASEDMGPEAAASTDYNIARILQRDAAAVRRAGMRSVRIKRGPGRSNWRPGAIHFPVFEHWLQTKCDLVSYQFSDEWSGASRIAAQVQVMRESNSLWSYLDRVEVVDGSGRVTGSRHYKFTPSRVPTNQLMTPSILVDRRAFEAVGGLDYPLHAAAKAEEWIQTHCALAGSPVRLCDTKSYYFFREHQESLGHGQGPKSKTYEDSVAETGWVEEDHWRLWNRIAPIHDERARKAREKL